MKRSSISVFFFNDKDSKPKANYNMKVELQGLLKVCTMVQHRAGQHRQLFWKYPACKPVFCKYSFLGMNTGKISILQAEALIFMFWHCVWQL